MFLFVLVILGVRLVCVLCYSCVCVVCDCHAYLVCDMYILYLACVSRARAFELVGVLWVFDRDLVIGFAYGSVVDVCIQVSKICSSTTLTVAPRVDAPRFPQRVLSLLGLWRMNLRSSDCGG